MLLPFTATSPAIEAQWPSAATIWLGSARHSCWITWRDWDTMFRTLGPTATSAATTLSLYAPCTAPSALLSHAMSHDCRALPPWTHMAIARCVDHDCTQAEKVGRKVARGDVDWYALSRCCEL